MKLESIIDEYDIFLSVLTKQPNKAAGSARKSRPQTSVEAAIARQIALSLIGSG